MTTERQNGGKKKHTTYFHIKASAKDPDAVKPWMSSKFVEWNPKRFGFLNFLFGERAQGNQKVATCFAHIKSMCDHLHDLAADSINVDESENPKRYDKRTAPLSQVTVYIQPFEPEGQPDRFRTDVAICVACYQADLQRLQRAEDQKLTDAVWTMLEGERFNVRDTPYPVICRRNLQKANPNAHVERIVQFGKQLLIDWKTANNIPDFTESLQEPRAEFLESLRWLLDRDLNTDAANTGRISSRTQDE